MNIGNLQFRCSYILIHETDPQSWQVMIIVFTHVVRPSARPHLSKIAKQNKFQAETMFPTGATVGLAEWIIEDTVLSSFIFDLRGPVE